MKVHSNNSLAVLSFTVIGLLTAWVVKRLNPETVLQLAHSSAGRVVLHMVCFWRDRRFLWHWQGIRREFSKMLMAVR
jgi:hypothetical protein